jgi:hypothetical protein
VFDSKNAYEVDTEMDLTLTATTGSEDYFAYSDLTVSGAPPVYIDQMFIKDLLFDDGSSN